MTVLDPFIAIARIDAIVALPFAIGIAVVALWRRQRPLTFNRIVEVGLPSLLLVAMGIRYVLLAPFILLLPGPILNAGAGIGALLAGLFVATSVVGFMSWHAAVSRKLAASVLLLALAIGEMALNFAWIHPPGIVVIDSWVGLAIALTAVVFAVFNWAHRSATPSPLGGANGPPLDY